MAPLTTTRTLFELRVGSFHTIEVLLQIRPSDISWWNSDLSNNERQLYKLLGRRVLPEACSTEIEAYRTKRKERDNAANNNEKKKKGEVVIGEANLKKKKATEKGKATGKKRGGKKKETKASKKQKLSDKSKDADSKDKKLPKLLREPGKWVMGKSIQICKLSSYMYTCLIFVIIYN